MSKPAQSWISYLAVLLALAFAAGCQSCQGTPDVPKASVEEKKPAAPAQQAAPAAVEDDEVDEDELVLLAEGDEEDGPAPLTVRFSVESLVHDQMNGPQYKWDFGDGSEISTEASPTHTYTKPGSYTAVIRIVDADGLLGWDEVEIEAEEPE